MYLPRLSIEGDISFLMDTGADSSILMPGDAKKLGIDFGTLNGDRVCGGIGGSVHCYLEPALLAFSDLGVAVHVYQQDIDIMHHDPEMEDVPSLLGRDILDHWKIVYDPQEKKIAITVRSADMTFDLKKRDGGQQLTKQTS